MAVTEYIGARYVPIFGRVDEESVIWDNSSPYEPLTIVLYQGNSYTSRQYVPAGIDISNELYWAETGNYNGQIEAYRNAVFLFDGRIDDLEEGLENTNETLTQAIQDLDSNLTTLIGDNYTTLDNKINGVQADVDKVFLPNNPIYYGADPTGANASDSAFAAAIAYAQGSNLAITPGRYYFESPLDFPAVPGNRVEVDFNGSILEFESGLDYCIRVGMDLEEGYPSAVNMCVMSNFELVTSLDEVSGTAIYFKSQSKSFRLVNFEIKGLFTNGIVIGEAGNRVPGDIYLENFSLNLQNSNIRNTGIRIHNTDCKFNNGFIAGVETAINNFANAIYMDNIHAIIKFPTELQESSATLANEIDSCFLRYNTETTGGVERVGNACYLSNCYCDTMKSFIKVMHSDKVVRAFLTNCKFYSYISSLVQIAFDFHLAVDYALKIVGGEYSFTSNDNNMGLYFRANNAGNVFNIKNASSVEGAYFECASPSQQFIADPLFSFHDVVRPYSPAVRFTAGQWYLASYINLANGTTFDLAVYSSGGRYWKGRIHLSTNGQSGSVTVDSSNNLEVGIATFAESANNQYAALCVKAAIDSDTFLELYSGSKCLCGIRPNQRVQPALIQESPDIEA